MIIGEYYYILPHFKVSFDDLFRIISEAAFADYDVTRDMLYGEASTRPITLMDLGTIGTKDVRARGLLPDLDASEEINACSVNIQVDHDGQDEDWLLMFKNETHNHPTEIEPYGGAATCLGGAIRDPLSGRSYVYQAMRLTGAGDVKQDYSNILKDFYSISSFY